MSVFDLTLLSLLLLCKQNEVLTVIDGMFLDPDEVCSFLLGPSCGQFYDPFNMWNISLPNRPRYNNKQETKHDRKVTYNCSKPIKNIISNKLVWLSL